LAAATAVPPRSAVAAPSESYRRTLVLTPGEMFKLAEVATIKGDLTTASAIYAALERNPDSDVRAEARFRYAKQLLGEKRNREAALLLRRLIDEKPSATVARLELAHTLQLLGEPGAALRELRAAQASGLPPAVARLVDRYSEALRASRPFGASFEIALAPDSNINRATRSDTLGTIFGDFDIGKDSKAKSGMGLSMQGQAYRRLSIGADNSLLIRLSGAADLYRKMDFNDIAVDLAAGPELRLGRNQLNFEAGATQRWFGQKPFMRSARIGATWVRPIGDVMQLRLSGSAALIDNQMNDLQSGKAFSGKLDLERALSATMGIGLNLSRDRQSLNDPGYSTTGWRVGLLGWRDVGRMTFTAEAEMGRLHADDRLQLFPDKRSDRYSSISLGATFRQLQWHGFAPVTRFSIERNRSTIEFYDYRRTRSEVGVVRAF
ncbi:MAG TPA: surface lipoprotein assembly modifier, partial [Sphingomicrobium sp.]|nr:surface lipoprotein assembly modifier [Sphingomicrobium sp.]